MLVKPGTDLRAASYPSSSCLSKFSFGGARGRATEGVALGAMGPPCFKLRRAGTKRSVGGA